MDQDETWHGGIGLGPGHIVLDGEPAPPSQRGTAAPSVFGPCLLWPNGWLDQDATWYGGRPQPRRDYVRSGPISHKGGQHPPLFGHVLCQTTGWNKMPRGMSYASAQAIFF